MELDMPDTSVQSRCNSADYHVLLGQHTDVFTAYSHVCALVQPFVSNLKLSWIFIIQKQVNKCLLGILIGTGARWFHHFHGKDQSSGGTICLRVLMHCHGHEAENTLECQSVSPSLQLCRSRQRRGKRARKIRGHQKGSGRGGKIITPSPSHLSISVIQRCT